jgi:hypothetical protein
VSPERESVQDKAQRLINDGRFKRLAPGIYACHGDTGRYLTTVVPDRAAAQRLGVPIGSCTCEAGRSARAVCAHLRGADGIEKHLASGGTYESRI